VIRLSQSRTILVRNCPTCGVELRVSDERRHQKLQCPKCLNPFGPEEVEDGAPDAGPSGDADAQREVEQLEAALAAMGEREGEDRRRYLELIEEQTALAERYEDIVAEFDNLVRRHADLVALVRELPR
jgi:molecular chaperone GrpE (heat shock protein)